MKAKTLDRWQLDFLELVVSNIPFFSKIELSPRRMKQWQEMGLTPKQAFNHWWSEGNADFKDIMGKIEVSK